MTEEEYVWVSNLAKLRIAVRVLGEAVALNDYEKELRDNAITPTQEWIELLEKSVRVRG